MNYRLIPPAASGGSVVLKRKYGLQRFLGIMLLVLGVPVFLSGLLLLLAEEGDMHGAVLWTGIGLFLLSGGVLVFTQVLLPDSMTFDNGMGALVIRERRRGGNAEYLPYADIAGFRVRLHRRDRTSSYAVEMEKKDGACWALLFYGSEAAASDACGIIAGSVKLNAPSSAPAPPAGPANGITIGERDGLAVISWKRRQPFIALVAGYALIAGFCMAIYGVAPHAENRFAYWIAAAFAAAVAAIAAVYFFYSIRRRYFVEVGKGIFRYYTAGLLLHGLRFSRPLPEIDSILFNLSVYRGETVLYVLSRDEREKLMAISRGDVQMGDILGAVSFMAKVPRIDTGTLGVAGKLRLERIIQEAVREKTGRTGL